MHLITFLGTGNYQSAAYELDGVIASPSCFVQAALAELLSVRQVTVLATSEAEARHGPQLGQKLSAMEIPCGFRRIPAGGSASEHWRIFSEFEQAVGEGPPEAEVALDITHGFRTLPVIGFLTAAFLRVTGRCRLMRMYYGAWELAEPAAGGGDKVAPVFDMTPFLELIDWLTASHSFLSTGQAGELADLLEEVQQALWRQGKSAADTSRLPTKLKTVGARLRDTSNALILLRRHELGPKHRELATALDEARSELERYAPPFGSILGLVGRSLGGFESPTVTDAPDSSGGAAILRREARQVRWLHDRGHTAAALTLLREWLVSLTAWRVDGILPEDEDARRPWETLLHVLGEHPGIDPSEVDAARLESARAKMPPEPGKLWNQLARTRNDLNHAGYNSGPSTANQILSRAQSIVAACLAMEDAVE